MEFVQSRRLVVADLGFTPRCFKLESLSLFHITVPSLSGGPPYVLSE